MHTEQPYAVSKRDNARRFAASALNVEEHKATYRAFQESNGIILDVSDE